MNGLHVAIDARLPDVGQGGVLAVLKAMAAAFSSHHRADIRRTWVVLKQAQWWRDALPTDDETIEVSLHAGSVAARLPSVSSRLAPKLLRLIGDRPYLDPLFEAGGVDVVHLPYQNGVTTSLPFLYFPHDLQHYYLPDFFTSSQIRYRETRWRQRAAAATYVAAAGQHVKRDLETIWGIPSRKILVYAFPSPPKPPLAVASPHGFCEPFVIYPAVFWPHKNHERLIQAVALLRSRGVLLRLVLTGARGASFAPTMQEAHDLGIADIVHYYGHVTDPELGRLIHDSAGVVIPSLFEAVSLTAFDAMRLGRQIACSDREFFRDQCGESAEYFDPLDPSSIAEAIEVILIKSRLNSSPMLSAAAKSALSLETFATNLLESYELCKR